MKSSLIPTVSVLSESDLKKYDIYINDKGYYQLKFKKKVTVDLSLYFETPQYMVASEFCMKKSSFSKIWHNASGNKKWPHRDIMILKNQIEFIQNYYQSSAETVYLLLN
ncbi:hypothetical protein EON71_00250 [bacterium]|nr:MAG: hypothetical protein EON71_00250 [bacterium]